MGALAGAGLMRKPRASGDDPVSDTGLLPGST